MKCSKKWRPSCRRAWKIVQELAPIQLEWNGRDAACGKTFIAAVPKGTTLSWIKISFTPSDDVNRRWQSEGSCEGRADSWNIGEMGEKPWLCRWERPRNGGSPLSRIRCGNWTSWQKACAEQDLSTRWFKFKTSLVVSGAKSKVSSHSRKFELRILLKGLHFSLETCTI